MTFSVILAFELAYLIGAIPFSIIIGRFFYGKDVRKEGSGNPGATNTFRVLGKRAGIIVLILDISKGMMAVSLSYYFGNLLIDTPEFKVYQLGLGLAATLGHVYPVYLWFKGGKGVATLFGVIMAVFPLAALFCTIAFLVVFISTRYVSVSSITAAILFPAVVMFSPEHRELPIIIFSLFIPALIIFTHRQNIRRLMDGTENKMRFGKKKRSNFPFTQPFLPL